jgi:ATP-dependent 26S proteasome regulatory subunit
VYIQVPSPDPRHEDFAVQFHDLPPAEREAIVLPEEVLQVVERNVLGFLQHAEALRQAGQSTRHGVLLHGPPGTGKTLVTRYLAQSCAPYTVLLLTGRQYAFLRPTFQLARLLAPSLVVLEDVDLIAADRRRNRHAPLLHELMDEMDGLGPGADCIFLLTTNRPESLEAALSARPGRVDQAIYFPLPDLECRRRLFAQFGQGLDLSGVDVGPLLGRTEGASPAFLKELFRRAALLAAERGERARPPRLTGEDFERALRELIELGGALTRNFLGFPARPSADGRG